MSGHVSKKYKIKVEIVVDFANSEIDRGAPVYVAEHYAQLALNDPTVGAIESKVLSVEEL